MKCTKLPRYKGTYMSPKLASLGTCMYPYNLIPQRHREFYLHTTGCSVPLPGQFRALLYPQKTLFSDFSTIDQCFSLLESHVSGLIPFVLFHVKLLSLSTMIVRSIHVFLSFPLLSCIVLHEYASAYLTSLLLFPVQDQVEIAKN